MYLHQHAVGGVAVAVAASHALPDLDSPTSIAIVIALCIVSHFVLDLFDEALIVGTEFEKIATMEILGLGALAGVVINFVPIELHGLALLGAIAGNVPDIWDKKLYLSMIDRKRWPMFNHWPCHWPSYPRIKMSGLATFLATVALLATIPLVA